MGLQDDDRANMLVGKSDEEMRKMGYIKKPHGGWSKEKNADQVAAEDAKKKKKKQRNVYNMLDD